MASLAPPVTDRLTIVVVGHVDHGKSTLLGRLYADTGSLPDGKLERVQAICRQQGKAFEYAFLFDAFLEEQEQGITIDSARTFFTWKGREYIIIDAPGHKEFLKNMVSGAARAEAALLVIDAAEGVQEQSRRHGQLLALVGVQQVAVVVNKMDLVGYSRDRYAAIVDEYSAFLEQLGVTPERFVPASASLGDNVAATSTNMPWYDGPTVLDTLGLFRGEGEREERPLRFPVQDVYKFDARRIVAGRVASGQVQVGDRLVFSPSNKSAAIRTIEEFNIEPQASEATAGRSIGFTLDEQIFIERGEIATHLEAAPLVSTELRCNLFWLGGQPLRRGRPYLLRLATQEVPAEVVEIHRVIDAGDLAAQNTAEIVEKNQVADVTVRTRAAIAFDLYREFEVTGRFVLVDDYDVAGGGIITSLVADEHATLRDEARRRELACVKGQIGLDDRATNYGHRAALVVLSGRDGEANLRLGAALERVLVTDGRHAYLLDGENLRQGLDADLRESDAQERVRRFGEVARLLLDTGLIVVATLAATAAELEAIRTLVQPAPMLIAELGGTGEAADLALDISNEADTVEHVIGELRRRDLLADPVGSRQRYRYAGTYAI
jgi:bifunctional enzyme CysN/CysC